MFFEIFFIDKARYLQIIAVRLLYQIRIGQFVSDPELASCFDQNVTMNPLDLNLVSRLEPVRNPVLFKRNATQLGLELEVSVLLKTLFDESDDSSLILRHPGHNSLLLLRADVFKFADNLVSVFVETFYELDCRRVNPVKFDAGFVKVKNIIVKPFALNEEHLELLLLPFVQALLNYLALVCSENLVFATGCRSEQSRLYRGLLVVRAR